MTFLGRWTYGSKNCHLNHKGMQGRKFLMIFFEKKGGLMEERELTKENRVEDEMGI
jgi:hypothetical protein